MNYRLILLAVLMAAVIFSGGCTDSGGKKADTGKAASLAAAGEPMELQPVPEGFPLGLSVSEGFAIHLFETPSGSQKFVKLPAESGAKRYYDDFTIAGKTHLVVTEEGNPPRLWFDVNRNGDLTDDGAPFPGETANVVPNHYSIQIRYEQELVEAPYRLWLFASNMGGVRFYPACHWRGTLTVKDRPYAVVAYDANSDGDYSNDPLVIDANGNDKADPEEALVPGQGVEVDDEQVTLVSISPSGLTVRLQR